MKRCAHCARGDSVLLSGVVFTARDAAHRRLIDLMQNNQALPIPLQGQVIYYAGPSPTRPGRPVGSLGPTTSGRMDAFTPALLKAGLKGMIGKGRRSQQVKDAMVQNGAVYFGAIGGAGALLSSSVISRDVLAFEELQSEAVTRLLVRDFPCIVLIDTKGNDWYELGPQQYLRAQNAPEGG